MRGDLVILHNGNVVPTSGAGAYYSDFSDILIINRGVHEPLEEYVFGEIARSLRSEPKMLELGSYWGHYSMWLKKIRPRSTVFLVEPDPVNMQAGRDNFERNHYDGHFIEAFVKAGHFEVDAFLEGESIDLLDVLHADIQGGELEMLVGATRSLSSRRISYVFVSTHSDELHLGVTEALAARGYRLEIDSDFSERTTSFDGFVFASNPELPPVFSDFAALGRNEIANASPSQLVTRLVAWAARQKTPAK